jgi:hypothetical protein
MSCQNLELVTYVLQKIGVLGADQTAPQPEDGVVVLNVINDYLLNEARDGMRLGWYPQTNLYATAPLRDEDIYGVKMISCVPVAAHYGVEIKNPMLTAAIADAYRQLVKRSIQYAESDLSELPRAQAGPRGSAGWL